MTRHVVRSGRRGRRPAKPSKCSILANALFSCCCWPYILGAYISECRMNYKNEKEKKRRQHEAWPLPLESSSSISFQILPQEQPQSLTAPKTTFFSLPLELRLSIYTLVFSLSDIHLMTFRYGEKSQLNPYGPEHLHYEYHLEAIPCTNEFFLGSPPLRQDARLKGEHVCLCASGYESYYSALSGRQYVMPRYRRSGIGAVNLMLVNRAFYHDVLSVTLNYRTFQIDNLDTVILAPIEMPERHFTRIRSLHLNAKYIAKGTTFTSGMLHFPKPYQEKFADLAIPNPWSSSLKKTYLSMWHAACKVISGMTSLKNLHVQLCQDAFAAVLFVRQPREMICNEAFVFKPLEAISKSRDLDIFEVEVDWPSGEEEWAGKEKAFTLIRVPPRPKPMKWS